jgi:hypothetical protein
MHQEKLTRWFADSTWSPISHLFSPPPTPRAP